MKNLQIEFQASARYTKQTLGTSTRAGEPAVDADEGLLLVGRQRVVEADGLLDSLTGPGALVEQAGALVERLGREVERLREVLQHVRRRLVEPALDLAQVGVRDVRHVREPAQRQVGQLALHANE